MIDIIWSFMIIIAVVFSIVNGTVSETLNSVIIGADSAVNFSIKLIGTMAFWMGMVKIAENTGITSAISKLLKPILVKLFPDYKNNDNVLSKISMTITANLLGLGNAATPLAISAINSMEDDFEKPSKNIILFVIINTASLQLIPTNIAATRSAFGSISPYSIMTDIWICSFLSLFITIFLCKLIEKIRGGSNDINR